MRHVTAETFFDMYLFIKMSIWCSQLITVRTVKTAPWRFTYTLICVFVFSRLPNPLRCRPVRRGREWLRILLKFSTLNLCWPEPFLWNLSWLYYTRYIILTTHSDTLRKAFEYIQICSSPRSRRSCEMSSTELKLDIKVIERRDLLFLHRSQNTSKNSRCE